MLVFDCLIIDNQNVMYRTLDKRYGVSYTKQGDCIYSADTVGPHLKRLTEWFFKPFKKMIQDHPQMLRDQAFQYVLQRLIFMTSADYHRFPGSK